MEFDSFWSGEAFTLAGQSVTYLQIAGILLGWFLLAVLLTLLRQRWLKWYFEQENIEANHQLRIRRVITFCLLLIGAWFTLSGLNIDFNLAQLYYDDAESATGNNFLSSFKFSTLIKVLLIYYVARLVDETLSDLLVRRYHQRREQLLKEGGIYTVSGSSAPLKVSYIVQPIVYILAVMFIIQEVDPDLGIRVPWLEEGKNLLRLNQILTALLILLFTRLGIWVLTEIVLYPYYRQKEINVGSQYAINRLLTYFVFVIAAVATLQYLGVNLTVLLGGAAALLVGIGLGLQQTFNDLICGIILLFERTVEIGDVVDIQGLVGTVKKIGIRTSLVETRDNVSVIVPNSKLVADNVVNWSYFDNRTRFRVSVGVAYGSDTELVRNILQEVATAHPKVLRRPHPLIRFVNFGDSSLDFEILFWSREMIAIEDVKSDLRFEIDRRFREANITIPFPQRDVWLRKEE